MFDIVGQYSCGVRFLFYVTFSFTALAATYFLDTQNQLHRLHVLHRKEIDLLDQFDALQMKKNNFIKKEEETKQLQAIFDSLKKQLCMEFEFPAIFGLISDSSIGLQFKLFEPGQEFQQDLYTVLPIRIILLGRYYQLVQFVKRLAELKFILALTEFVIEPVDQLAINTPLKMEVQLRVFKMNCSPD